MNNESRKFADLVRIGTRGSAFNKNASSAVSWFRSIATKHGLAGQDSVTVTNSVEPGNMYMFSYDAKHKATLPYYDANPIIFPIAQYSDGFLGINFHYLPIPLRATMMDLLYPLVSDTSGSSLSKSAKLNLSYRTLMRLSNNRLFKPCIKRYLYSQFRSRFAMISPEAWELAIFLPMENFQGASASTVWNDSVRAMN